MLNRLPLASLVERSAQLFALAFSLFIYAQFVLSSHKIWGLVFYLAVLPAAAALSLKLPPYAQRSFGLAPMRVTVVLLIWLCLSLTWQEGGTWYFAFNYLRHSAITVLFILSALTFFSLLKKPQLEDFWNLLIAVVTLTGIASIARFLGGYEPNAIRLEAIGQLAQPIFAAAIYGLVGIIALHKLLTCERPSWWPLYLLAITIIVCLLFLTYSRGQMVAFALTSIIMLTRYSSKISKVLLLTVLVAGISLLLLLLAFPAEWRALSEQLNIQMIFRESYRLHIWNNCLEAIAQKPIFGWGAASVLITDIGDFKAVHMHNLLLGALYYGGIIAGGLLIALFVMLTKTARSLPERSERIFCGSLLLYTILSVVTDNPSLVDSPAPFWTIFWLPICYVLARGADGLESESR